VVSLVSFQLTQCWEMVIKECKIDGRVGFEIHASRYTGVGLG
jgi:hypothetical protein